MEKQSKTVLSTWCVCGGHVQTQNWFDLLVSFDLHTFHIILRVIFFIAVVVRAKIELNMKRNGSDCSNNSLADFNRFCMLIHLVFFSIYVQMWCITRTSEWTSQRVIHLNFALSHNLPVWQQRQQQQQQQRWLHYHRIFSAYVSCVFVQTINYAKPQIILLPSNKLSL